LVYFPPNGLAFTVDDCVLYNDAKFRRVYPDYLKFDLLYTITSHENIALLYWPVSILKVRSNKCFKYRAIDVLNICHWKDSNTLSLSIVNTYNYQTKERIGIHIQYVGIDKLKYYRLALPKDYSKQFYLSQRYHRRCCYQLVSF